MESVMDRCPDFYIYGGEGNQHLLDVVRACWKFGSLQSQGGKEISLVRIVPPASHGILSADAQNDVIGLASRSTLFEVGEFGSAGYSGAVVWEVNEKEEGHYVALRSLGIVVIWKDRQTMIRHNPSAKF
jgi:hypothetical protein